MSEFFDYVSVTSAFISSAFMFWIFLIFLRRYLEILPSLKNDPPVAIKIQAKVNLYMVLFGILSFLAIFTSGFAYYFAATAESSYIGSIFDTMVVLFSLSIIIPIYGVLSIITFKKRLFYFPLIYWIVLLIVVILTFETHVGTNYDQGIERSTIVSILLFAAIVFFFILYSVFMIQKYKISDGNVKKEAKYLSLGGSFIAIGFLFTGLGRALSNSAVFVIGYNLFIVAGLLYYIHNRIATGKLYEQEALINFLKKV